MFKVSDFYGIIAGMFVLILVYLMLNKGDSTVSVLGSLFNGSNNLVRNLQGRD